MFKEVAKVFSKFFSFFKGLFRNFWFSKGFLKVFFFSNFFFKKGFVSKGEEGREERGLFEGRGGRGVV